MTLEEIKIYLLKNKIVSKVRIVKNRRYIRTLWGYKYPNRTPKYPNFAEFIYNQDDIKDKDIEYIKKDIELITGLLNID